LGDGSSPHSIPLQSRKFLEGFPKNLSVERYLGENSSDKMDPALKTAFGQPDVNAALLAAVDHADVTMKRYMWRGFRPQSNPEREFGAGDKAAKDFVNEALRRLCDGTRTYNPQKTLLENLNSVTDSLIWSEKKSSDRVGVVDFAKTPDQADQAPDPISSAVSPQKSADATLLQKEIVDAQAECFRLIKASFDGDPETQNYLEALREGFFKIEEISSLTGIPVERIYEIRRKLKNFAPKFFGVPNYREMERKLNEGK
jgi:hypothetical protein